MINKARRRILFVLILGIILFVGLVFSAWVVPNIIQPVAQTVWLFLRVFVLNIDQVHYWNLLTFVVAIWAIYRLTRRKSSVLLKDDILRNEVISSINNWQESLILSKQNASIARNKLLQLLISHYAAGQASPNYLEIKQGLQQRTLELPESVFNYLFATNSQTPGDKTLVALLPAISRWYRRITRQEASAFNRMIDELIDFMKPR